MKTEYNGIEINYVEGTDDWHFELRGRSRKADSLAKAKEAIDKEPAEKRTQAFPRFQAHFYSYSQWQIVTVTSVAADGYYGAGTAFWCNEKDGKRRKERDSCLYPVNPHNDALVVAIKEKDKQIEKIEKEKSDLFEKLQKAAVPAEIAK